MQTVRPVLTVEGVEWSFGRNPGDALKERTAYYQEGKSTHTIFFAHEGVAYILNGKVLKNPTPTPNFLMMAIVEPGLSPAEVAADFARVNRQKRGKEGCTCVTGVTARYFIADREFCRLRFDSEPGGNFRVRL